MECEMTEKVSLMVDDELPSHEKDALAAHLLTCASCQQAHQDFLRLRAQLQAYPLETPASPKVLREILASAPVPIWKRKIVIPVPAFAFSLLVVVAFAVWMWSFKPAPRQSLIKPPANLLNNEQVSQREIDFSRYDQGERAVIYKTRRTDTRPQSR